jgi:hypothetical protein
MDQGFEVKCVQGSVRSSSQQRWDQGDPGPRIEEGGLRVGLVWIAAEEAESLEGELADLEGLVGQILEHIVSVGEIPQASMSRSAGTGVRYRHANSHQSAVIQSKARLVLAFRSLRRRWMGIPEPREIACSLVYGRTLTMVSG